MKQLFLGALLVQSFLCRVQAQQVYIRGDFVLQEKHQDILPDILLELRRDTIVLGRSSLKPTGSFEMTVPAFSSADLFYKGISIPEVYICTVNLQGEDSLMLNIRIPREYSKERNCIICPKCHQHDQNIPIEYGLKTIVVNKRKKLPYTTYQGYGNREIYDGGCVTSPIGPRYYCKRDQIQF